jgi:hypothetical protein
MDGTVEASVDGSAMALPAGDEEVGYTGFDGASSRYGTVQFDFLVTADAETYYELECGGVVGGQDVYVSQNTPEGEWLVSSDNLDDEFLFTPIVGEWWTVKCEKTETTCKIKAWKRTLAEPGTWGLEETPGRQIAWAYDSYLEIDSGAHAAKIDNLKIWVTETSAIIIPPIIGIPTAVLVVSPSVAINVERSGLDMVVTISDDEVVATTGAFVPADVGKPIAIQGVTYQVVAVVSPTTIQLDRPYGEASGSGKVWSLGGVYAQPPRIFTGDDYDFRVLLFPHTSYEVDVTGLCMWAINVEQSLGSPATASFTLQDRAMGDYDFADLFLTGQGGLGGCNLERADIEIIIIGQQKPIFRGAILNDTIDLPVAFPWRFHKISATDYQRELFSERLVGIPGGSLWWRLYSWPDSEPPICVDPRVYLSGSDKGVVATLFQQCAALNVPGGWIDADTYVYQYIASIDNLVGSGEVPVTPDRAAVGAVLDQLTGLIADDNNVQYWLDQALMLHYVALPRWWEQPEDVPDPLESAPVDISDVPDGVTSIGCRNLGWAFDYSSIMHQFYVNGGTGYMYNNGDVELNGTGAVAFGSLVEYPSINYSMAVLNDGGSIDETTKLAVAARARKATQQGILRGHCTVGNERHHPDGWHVGQVVKITDARMPAYLNDRYYVIQKVTTKLVPMTNWRIYDLEWGDAPIARSSSRRYTKDDKKPDLPGRLWDIGGRIQNPLPGSTITVVGQLTDDAGKERRVPGVSVDLELHVWDDTGTPVEDVGSISPETVTSDAMGRWSTQMTVGSELGYRYCVCPVGSGSCVLPT